MFLISIPFMLLSSRVALQCCRGMFFMLADPNTTRIRISEPLMEEDKDRLG